VQQRSADGNRDGGLVRFLVPWAAAALVDSYLALGAWPRPAWWQFAGEILFLLALGRVQYRLARGWLRSSLLAAAVLCVFALAVHAPKAPHQLAPFLLGLAGGALSVVWAIERRWHPPILVGTVVALGVVIGARWLDGMVISRPQGSVAPSLVDAIAWPFRMVVAPASTSDGPPLVIISVDTLRRDAAARMASYARLAARGAAYPHAMSTSSWTLPALASLQTGRMPAEHGAGCLEDGHCQGLAPQVRALAEDLSAHGYLTSAVVSNPWIGRGTGFDRGFATLFNSGDVVNRLVVGGPPWGVHRQDDARTVDAALAWLTRAPRRGFYLWVHLFGPHMPYLHAADPIFRTLDPTTLRSTLPLSDARRREVRAAYDAEVAYTDVQVMRLLDGLERHGVLDEGVVVFTADHGEEFWEHGGVEHGHSHHGEVVDVPLILLAPGLEPGERSGVVSLVDVAPTLRVAAGLPAEGIDLRDAIPADRVAGAWGGLIQHLDCSARDAGRRVILRDCRRSPHAISSYDLARDPAEREPVRTPPADSLVEAAAGVAPPLRGAPASLPVEQLRALGYVQ
jgi:arylsulfatase